MASGNSSAAQPGLAGSVRSGTKPLLGAGFSPQRGSQVVSNRGAMFERLAMSKPPGS